jgi:hypothetical protein
MASWSLAETPKGVIGNQISKGEIKWETKTHN